MTARKLLLAALVITGTIAVVALAPRAWTPPAAAAPGCDLADLSGSYAFVVHGTNPLGQPFGAIGSFTADGAGTLDGFRVSLDDGDYSTAAFSCTYAMSPGCFFRGPCVDDGEVTAEVQIDGVFADGRKEIELLLSGLPHGAPSAVGPGGARRR